MNYASIRIEGNIISSEILDKLEQGDYAGQSARDYGFESKLKVKDDIQFAWVNAKDYWKIFQRKLERLPSEATRTSETRNDWIRPLLELLGYALESAKPETIGEKSYPISNRATNIGHFPVHGIGFQADEKDEKNDLDKRQNTYGSKMSAHGMVQEYLNLSGHVYALVTNGRYLRLLRDSGRIVKLSFLEFDLYRMMEDDLYSDFAIMYRLLHATRMPRTMEEAETSIIEKYHQDSLDAGSRIRSALSKAVERSILSFANGFLEHPSNAKLVAAIQEGDVTAEKMYQELLRLIYRFLFLMVTEERHLIYSDENDKRSEIYYNYYSVNRLRILAEKRPYDQGRYDDLWEQLKVTFKFFEKKIYGEKIGILPLDGDLFSFDAVYYIRESRLKNSVLLECLRNLCTFYNEQNQLIRVNYGSLDVEEFGSVYEGLLEYDAILSNENGQWKFSFKKGEGRSSSGSHYTPEELVQPLIKHSLDYIIEEKLSGAEKSVIARSPANMDQSGITRQSPKDLIRNAKRNALLSIKVCDVACGSGHILLSAARRIATRLAQVMTDEEQPSPKSFREAIREVIRHCIYGVDKNPLAVELCKVSLWLEAHNPGMPLTFLDHRIKCGDSIVGVGRIEELYKGIPTEAFKTLPGDDKEFASLLRKKNELEIKEWTQQQLRLDDSVELIESIKPIANDYKMFGVLSDNSVDDFHNKREKYYSLHGATWMKLQAIANLQTAQFFISKKSGNKNQIATDGTYRRIVTATGMLNQLEVSKANSLFYEKKFFHWFLEFPEVFEQGGFDCILGNPPFLGGSKITGSYGDDYLNWLKLSYKPAGGLCDLVGYFFRRNYDLINQHGFTAMIATNTISQGDTRDGSLSCIVNNGGSIHFAIKSLRWPGVANLYISQVGIFKGKWNGGFLFDNRVIEYISPYFDEIRNSRAFTLKTNSENMYLGSKFLGEGFIIDEREKNYLIAQNITNSEVIFPLINGKDINDRTFQEPERFIINFFNWDFERARSYELPFAIIEEKVKPERLNNNDSLARERWWNYLRPRMELYSKLSQLSSCFVIAKVTKYLSLTKSDVNRVFTDNVFVLISESYSDFSLLQCSLFDVWTRKYSSSLANTLNFAPTDCYETFPFPQNISPQIESELKTTGEKYYEYRKSVMLKMQLGLTKAYNLFHNPKLTSEIVQKESKQTKKITASAYQDILTLRQLHKQMDETVLKAYGWLDVHLEHGFHEVEYLPENDRIRYTISELARKEILKRLLKLNHEIHEEEVKKQAEVGVVKKLKKAKKEKEISTDEIREYVTLLIALEAERAKRVYTVKILLMLQTYYGVKLGFQWGFNKQGPLPEEGEFYQLLDYLAFYHYVEIEPDYKDTKDKPIRLKDEGIKRIEILEKQYPLSAVKESVQEILKNFDPKKYGSRDMELRGTLYFLHIIHKDWLYDRLVEELIKLKPHFTKRETEVVLLELINKKYVDKSVG